ncbi:hypothetical protein C8J57DRAFT_1462173 [Mycena rebaudengoi]|nr:hypothetical protein C8J57DRAFT_1462173 [Mycena rebaudengoi]
MLSALPILSFAPNKGRVSILDGVVFVTHVIVSVVLSGLNTVVVPGRDSKVDTKHTSYSVTRTISAPPTRCLLSNDALGSPFHFFVGYFIIMLVSLVCISKFAKGWARPADQPYPAPNPNPIPDLNFNRHRVDYREITFQQTYVQVLPPNWHDLLTLLGPDGLPPDDPFSKAVADWVLKFWWLWTLLLAGLLLYLMIKHRRLIQRFVVAQWRQLRRAAVAVQKLVAPFVRIFHYARVEIGAQFASFCSRVHTFTLHGVLSVQERAVPVWLRARLYWEFLYDCLAPYEPVPRPEHTCTFECVIEDLAYFWREFVILLSDMVARIVAEASARFAETN